jgi:hypothetical protein
MYFYKKIVCTHADESMFKNVNIVRRFKNKKIITNIKKNIIDIAGNIDQLDVSDNVQDALKLKYLPLKLNIENLDKTDYGHGVLMLVIEKGDIDLSKYISSLQKISSIELMSISFQILQALCTMHEYLGVVHLDLHLYNILIKYIQTTESKKTLFKTYKIFDKTYYVPNIGINIAIIDFGRSEFLYKMKPNEIANEALSQYNFLASKSNAKSIEFYNRVKRNVTKNINHYREYLKSFDVWRVFTELYIACKDIADTDGLEFLRNVIDDSGTDFLSNLPSYSIKLTQSSDTIYNGHPKNILQKYIYKKGIFVDNLSNNENYMNDTGSKTETSYTISSSKIKIFTKYNNTEFKLIKTRSENDEGKYADLP